jgi:hypothetical protein
MIKLSRFSKYFFQRLKVKKKVVNVSDGDDGDDHGDDDDQVTVWKARTFLKILFNLHSFLKLFKL